MSEVRILFARVIGEKTAVPFGLYRSRTGSTVEGSEFRKLNRTVKNAFVQYCRDRGLKNLDWDPGFLLPDGYAVANEKVLARLGLVTGVVTD